MRMCKAEQCLNDGKIVLGYCTKHYQRLKKYGDANTLQGRKIREVIVKGEFTYIPLGNSNEMAIVDSDISDVSKHNWHLNSRGYPMTGINYKKVLLHHFIIGKPPEGFVTDHINRNRFDNRRSNLRFITIKENTFNSSPRKNTSSKFKGVSFNKSMGKFVAYIHHGKYRKHLGFFDKEIDAATAYDKEAIELRGEFAVLNNPTGSNT